MGSRRRNLFILLFVVGLMVAGLARVIATKKTVLGLDLRGGTELVYEGRPTPQNPEIDGEDIDRSIEIIRERTDSLGVSEPEISRVGTDQIRIGLPDVENAERAQEQVGSTAQLYFYDWEPNVDPPSRACQEGRAAHRPALRRGPASPPSRSRSASRTGRMHDHGPTYYLFDRNTKELAAGPGQQPRGPLPRRRPAAAEGRSEIIEVPAGNRWSFGGGAAATTRTPRSTRTQTAAPRLLRDQGPAGALGRRHQGPRAELRSDHQPADRHLRLHRRGARSRSRT